MQEAPSLKLSMLQSPREGETLEFRPGISVRIGRVVRGNTLSIKDSGISSHHLSIETESSGKWVLRDLNSSNGTLLDGTKILPLTPFLLHDGATIEIGELTSIHVTLLLIPPRPETARVTRNSRRNNPIVAEKMQDDSEEKAVEKPKKTRVTWKSKMEQSVFEISDSSLKVVGQPKIIITRATRNSKKESVGSNSPPKNLNLECRLENVEPKKTRGRGRMRKLMEEPPAQVAELREENFNGDEDWRNLEKITLAEWFDFLQVHLPKQIINETEEMIVSMGEKAERLREYIIHQMKNDNEGKMPV